jgi:hypothetical protein
MTDGCGLTGQGEPTAAFIEMRQDPFELGT